VVRQFAQCNHGFVVIQSKSVLPRLVGTLGCVNGSFSANHLVFPLPIKGLPLWTLKIFPEALLLPAVVSSLLLDDQERAAASFSCSKILPRYLTPPDA
jgi:hypothetical protein